jgi:transcriptional regulator GlxA family with amidase domain
VNINFLLFPNLETLDLFGPAEVLGHMPGSRPGYFSLAGGLIETSQKALIMTQKACEMIPSVLVVPGGQGTRTLAADSGFLDALRDLARPSAWVLSVCTGSALLAAAGLLDGLKAAGNKRAWEWSTGLGPKVKWQKRARWVSDGRYYTSAGISAGIDMSLGFVSDRLGPQAAEEIAGRMEYVWNSCPDQDPFALD